MTTEFKITRLETVSDTTHLYLVVEFYVDDTLTHTEDFIIARPSEKRTYTGLVGLDDEVLEPDKYLVEPMDIKQEILAVIEGFEHIHRDDVLLVGGSKQTSRVSQITTDQSDPNGWLNRLEVKDLINKRVLI